MAQNPFSVTPEEMQRLRQTYKGRTTKPTDMRTFKVDAKPRAKPQPKLEVVPMPSASSVAQSVLGMLKGAPQGIADLAVSIPTAAYNYATTHTPGEVASDVKRGVSGFVDYVRGNPLEALIEMSPAGTAKGAGEMLREASLARDAGDEERAMQIEKFAVPMLLGALVPGGRAVKGAERAVAREGVGTLSQLERELDDIGVKHALSQRGDIITVNKIVVPEGQRNQGVGSKAMKAITDYADASGHRVALSPSTDFGATSKSRLANFYKKHGFSENKGKSRDLSVSETMLREPVVSADAPSAELSVTPSSASRITFPDEADWELPNFDEPVEITTLPTPASILRTQNVTGWHGSPTKFAAERKLLSPTGETSFAVGKPGVLPDVPAGLSVERDYPLGRFRSDFVNTGEGAQQYSIGTYLAENPDVARNYRSELTRDMSEPTIGGLALSEVYDRLQRQADRSSDPQTLYDRLAVLEDLAHDTDPFGVRQRAKLGSYSPETLQWFEQNIAPTYDAPGALYKVRANVDPRELLDWDAPLANQTEAIRRAAEGLDLSHLPSGNRSRVMMERFLNREEQPSYPLTGQMFLSALPHTPEGNYSKEASDYLLKFGVPGVKYWDEGSREMGKGTRNFVIYDPERDLDIIERFAVGGRV